MLKQLDKIPTFINGRGQAEIKQRLEAYANVLHKKEILLESFKSQYATLRNSLSYFQRLGEASQEISKVISLINQIAMQTRMLSLNASIEAVRAGKEGQGFTVVAQEVGKLAIQSSEATKEIEQLIKNIQRETSVVVKAMELGNTQVLEGTHLVEDAKQNLQQIVEVSRQIDQRKAEVRGQKAEGVSFWRGTRLLATERSKGFNP